MEGVGACYTIHATCHVKERGLSRLGFGRDRGLSNRRRKRTSSSRPYIYRKKKKKKRPLPSRGRIKRRALEVGGGLAAIVLPLPRRAAPPPLPFPLNGRPDNRYKHHPSPSLSPSIFLRQRTPETLIIQVLPNYILHTYWHPKNEEGKIWSTELKS